MLDLAAGEPLGTLDDGSQGMAVVSIAWQRLSVQQKLAARGAGVGGDERDLHPEFPGRAGVTLADALHLRGMEGIKLPAALCKRCSEAAFLSGCRSVMVLILQ